MWLTTLLLAGTTTVLADPATTTTTTAPPAPPAPPLAPLGVPIEINGEFVTQLPGPPRAVVPVDQGVWLLTATGEIHGWERSEDGAWEQVTTTVVPNAVGIFAAGDRIWVETQETRATPLTGSSSPAFAPAPPPVGVQLHPASNAAKAKAKNTTETRGSVLRTEPGVAIIDMGRSQNITADTEVRIFGFEEVEVPSLDGDGTEITKREKVVATGVAEVIQDNRAMITLDRGGRASEGDRVEIHPGASAYPSAPTRFGGVSEAGFIIRPLLALDTVGVAFVNEAWYRHVYEGPWYTGVRLSPLAMGWSRDGNPISLAGILTGGYDSSWFSVGLGTGWSRLNGDASNYGYSNDYALASDESGGFSEEVQFEDVESAFSIAQEARLGAEDGIHLTVRNTFILVPSYEYGELDGCDWYEYDDETGEETYNDCTTYEEVGNEFVFGGIGMRFVMPVSTRSDLLIDWGTGRAGATWVTGGVSAWVRGNGDTGSMAVEIAAGYGSLYGEPNDEYVSLYGPLVSAGFRWRL